MINDDNGWLVLVRDFDSCHTTVVGMIQFMKWESLLTNQFLKGRQRALTLLKYMTEF